MIRDITNNIDKIMIALLVILSLSMSLKVWTAFGDSWIYIVCLAIGAIVVEGVKVIAISATYRLAGNGDYRFLPALMLAIVTIVLSVGSSTLFLDAAMISHDHEAVNEQQSKVEQQRIKAIQDIAIANAKTYSEHGWATKSTEVLKQFGSPGGLPGGSPGGGEIGGGVGGGVGGGGGGEGGPPHDIRASELLSKVDGELGGRIGAFIFIGGFIDFALAVLLIIRIPSVPRVTKRPRSKKPTKPKAQIPAPVVKRNVVQKTNNLKVVDNISHLEESLRNHIESMKDGSDFSMRDIEKAVRKDRKNFKPFFEKFENEGLIEKGGKSYKKCSHMKLVGPNN